MDVAQECVRMKLWLDEHPKGHPTLKKLKGFISRWLGNAQEKVCQQLGIPAPGESNLDWDEFFELARVK